MWFHLYTLLKSTSKLKKLVKNRVNYSFLKLKLKKNYPTSGPSFQKIENVIANSYRKNEETYICNNIWLGDATVFAIIPTDFPATHHNRFQQGRRKKNREPSQNATKIKFFSSFLGGYCYWAPILWAPKMIVLLYMIVNTIVIFFLFF